MCIFSLAPYAFSGSRLYSIVPISIWIFYNMLFLLGPRHSNLVIPGFGKFKHSFKATIEDFFSPRLLPVLSISFLLVVLSLTVTGHRLGGPPLCFQKCGQCLRRWDASIPLILDAGNVMSENIVNGNVNSVRNLLNGASEDISDSSFSNYDQSNRYYHRLMADESGGQFKNVNMQLVGCGHVNGKELLGYYTMAQTSFLLFLTVLIGMAVCLAWRIAEEEKEEQTTAEEWLQTQDSKAFEMRNELIKQFGRPASAIRPEGSAVWVIYGINAALTFTLLGKKLLHK